MEFNILEDLTGKITKVFPDAEKPACKDTEKESCCDKTGVTDKGVINSAKWRALLAAGVEVYNVANSLRMAKLQRDLGRKYLDLAKENRNYYNERFKPLEQSLTKEALNLPKYVRDKDKFYAGQMLTSVRGKFAGGVENAVACTGRYCTGQRAAIITDQLLQQAAAESLAAGLAHRYADKEEINRNNLRWEKREQVMRIGRDIPADAVSYANLAAGTFGSLGKQAGQAAEGIAGFLGGARRDTEYPARRGSIQVPSYTYIPQRLETPEITPRPTYQKPKPEETTIKLSG